MALSGLYARLRHAFLVLKVFMLLIFFSFYNNCISQLSKFIIQWNKFNGLYSMRGTHGPFGRLSTVQTSLITQQAIIRLSISACSADDVPARGNASALTDVRCFLCRMGFVTLGAFHCA